MARAKAYLVMGSAYAVACAGGFALFYLLNGLIGIPLAVLVADVAATLVIWAFGLVFKNSSFYDAYWSLIPWLIVLMIICHHAAFNINNILFLIVFGIWSFRLTLNWAYTCTNLKWEDWRYQDYRNNTPLKWHAANLFGIHLIPTLVVYSAVLPAIHLIPLTNAAFNPLQLIGLTVILIGTALELFADLSMHRFKHTNTDPQRVLDQGLWKHSRHPNYFGEITIWIGVYLCTLLQAPSLWHTFFGAVVVILLFVFVSVPLAEKRQLKKRPAYAKYRETTSMLIPLPNRKPSN